MRGDFRDRKYSDEEFRRIIEDATRLEQEAARPSGGHDGHTLAEIREIAHEVGIDPADVDRAAASLVAAESIDSRSSGLSRVLHEERVIGRPLTNAEMRLVAAQAERVLGWRGTLRDAGDWVEWRDVKDRLYVGVVRGSDRTRIRVIADQSVELLRGSVLIGVLGLFGMTTVGGMSPAVAVAVVVLIVAATFGLIRFYGRWRGDATRNHMRELLDILQEAVQPP